MNLFKTKVWMRHFHVNSIFDFLNLNKHILGITTEIRQYSDPRVILSIIRGRYYCLKGTEKLLVCKEGHNPLCWWTEDLNKWGLTPWCLMGLQWKGDPVNATSLSNNTETSDHIDREEWWDKHRTPPVSSSGVQQISEWWMFSLCALHCEILLIPFYH